MIKNILNPLYLLTIFVRGVLCLRQNGLNRLVNSLRKYSMVLYLFLIAINIAILSYYLVNLLPIQLPDYYYFDGVALFFNGHKKIELLEYILGTAFLGLWFFIIVIYSHNLSNRARRYLSISIKALVERGNLTATLITFSAGVLVPIVVNNIGHYNFLTVLIQLFCVLVIIIVPLWSYLNKFGANGFFKPNFLHESKKIVLCDKSIREGIAQKGIWIVLAIVSLSFLCYLFYEPFVGKPKIINEYFNIPEQTLIKDKGNNVKIVDNTTYWNQHFPSPLTFKGDIKSLQYVGNCLDATPESMHVFMNELDQYQLYYNKTLRQFCINGDFSENAFSSFQNQSLYNVLNLNNYLKEQQTTKSYNSNEKYFLQANEYEIHWQMLSRFMIHHNSFMFIPISSLMLNESSAPVNAQYGLSNARLFAYFFNKYGDISFDNWLRVSYSFYLVYFLMLILVIAFITRSYAWTAIILVMSLSVENLHGYDFLLLAPGDSPWRNLLDLLSLLMIFIYSRQKNFIFYLIALFLGLVSIIFNPQMGIMILASTLLSGVFCALYERLRIKLTLISSILALVFAFYLYITGTGHDDLAKYYIDGVIGFPINFIQLIKIFIAIIISYMIIVKIIQKQATRNYIYLIFLVIYAQELLLYVVWHFNTDGFLARGYIYVITLLLLVFQFKDYCSENFKKMLCVIALGVYGYSVIFMLQSKYQYDKIFDQHVIYNWNLDRAHITSTMNPVYFENGVKLIDKYSKNKNGIYIISEYDNFLPFLAHKYSLMPFFDMKWYVVTPRELNKTIDLLKTQQPEYLFVDTGIDRNLNNEIIESSLPTIGYLNQESVWRVQRLKLLNLVFQSVASNYIMVESGSLISVYKLKNKIR